MKLTSCARLLLVASLLAFTPIVCYGEEEEKSLIFIPGLVQPLPVDLFLPEDYGIASSVEGESPDLIQGVFWGKKEDIYTLWSRSKVSEDPEVLSENFKKALGEIHAGVFQVGHSLNVGQIAYREFSAEKTLDEDIAQLPAGSSLEYKKVMWGDYPVLVLDYTHSDGQETSIAYVGLNYAGNTIQIRFLYPQDGNKHLAAGNNTPDRLVWEEFIKRTEMLPRDRLLKVMGIDMEIGKTVIKATNGKVQALAERRNSDNKVRVLLTPVTEQTDFEAFSCITGLVQDFSTECVKVALRVDSQAEGINCVTSCNITVNPRDVDEFSLEGETVLEYGDISVLREKTETS
ncbi:MAG: hypothetical protein ACI9S8_002877 [Chlamydiales bacterium]|jgi:hypothetical protein